MRFSTVVSDAPLGSRFLTGFIRTLIYHTHTQKVAEVFPWRHGFVIRTPRVRWRDVRKETFAQHRRTRRSTCRPLAH
ncbi:MAG: hypothetical protein RLZZ234_248 [Candidatus Parcubacteria bacterium]